MGGGASTLHEVQEVKQEIRELKLQLNSIASPRDTPTGHATTRTDRGDPVRSALHDFTGTWRTKKPDYTIANRKFHGGRTQCHKEGSLEMIVENLVKTWEMEASHKPNFQEWSTIDPSVYRISANGGPKLSIEENCRIGNYNSLMMDEKLVQAGLYDAKKQTFESSHDLFRTCFPDGFAWELLEVFSGPPRVVCTWRHWGTFSGPYTAQDGTVVQPTGEALNMTGMLVATVNADLKLTELEIYYDPRPFLAHLAGKSSEAFTNGCPFHTASSSNVMRPS